MHGCVSEDVNMRFSVQMGFADSVLRIKDSKDEGHKHLMTDTGQVLENQLYSQHKSVT